MWVQVLMVALAVGLAVLLLPRAAANIGVVFRIQVHAGGPRLRGRVPGHSPRDVLDFVSELGLPRGARIVARRDDARFRLEFTEDIPPDERQRLRNFLYLHV